MKILLIDPQRWFHTHNHTLLPHNTLLGNESCRGMCIFTEQIRKTARYLFGLWRNVTFSWAAAGKKSPGKNADYDHHRKGVKGGVQVASVLLQAANHRANEGRTESRVAKCHRYGRYICVKILEGWGETCRRPCSFVRWGSFWVNSTHFYLVSSVNQLYLIRFPFEVAIYLNFIKFKCYICRNFIG